MDEIIVTKIIVARNIEDAYEVEANLLKEGYYWTYGLKGHPLLRMELKIKNRVYGPVAFTIYSNNCISYELLDKFELRYIEDTLRLYTIYNKEV